jgi:hypothetical protein
LKVGGALTGLMPLTGGSASSYRPMLPMLPVERPKERPNVSRTSDTREMPAG